MSMDLCERCARLVDTDARPEAYVSVPWLRPDRFGDTTRCYCMDCQEELLEQHGLEEFPT